MPLVFDSGLSLCRVSVTNSLIQKMRRAMHDDVYVQFFAYLRHTVRRRKVKYRATANFDQVKHCSANLLLYKYTHNNIGQIVSYHCKILISETLQCLLHVIFNNL